MVKGKYKWTLRLSVLTPILLMFSVFIMGGGHGYFEPTICLFPWATVSIIWLSTLTLPYIIVGLIQYPMYGFLIDKTDKKGRAFLLILLIHMILAIIILKYRNENWT
jgi:hypothetical protein